MVLNLLRRVNVEIIAIFVGLAYSMILPNITPGRAQKMKDYYWDEFKDMDSFQQDVFVQQKLVEWDNYKSAIEIPVSAIAVAYFGAWGDIHGRQINMIMGAATVVASTAEYMLQWSHSFNWPLWTVFPIVVFSSAMGSTELTSVSFNAYLADTIPDKKTLSFRLMIIFALFSGISAVGNFATTFLSRQVYLIDWIAIANFFFAVAVFLMFFLVPQIPPMQLAKARKRASGITESEDEADYIPQQRGLLAFVANYFKLTWASLRTLFIRRQPGVRPILLAVILTVLIDSVAIGESYALFTKYMVRETYLHWDGPKIGMYMGISTVINLVGLIVGTFLYKYLFKFRDTTVLVIQQISGTLSVGIMIFASADWHIYLRPIIGAFGAAARPIGITFMTRLVGLDEIGKTFTFLALMSTFSRLVQQYVLQIVYQHTVGTFPQLVWIIITIMLGLGAAITTFVHFKSVKSQIEEKTQSAAALTDYKSSIRRQ